MDMQNVSNLQIPEGAVRTIHDKYNRLIWGRLAYDTKYAGDTYQQTYSGKNLFNGAGWRSARVSSGYPTPSSSGGTIVSSSANSIKFNATATYDAVESGFIPVANGQTMTFSTSTVKACNRFFITQYNSSKVRVSTLNSVITSVRTSTVAATQDGYITVAFGNTSIGDDFEFNNIQLELGSSASPFEPYVGGIPAPNPDYPQDVQVVTGAQTVTISDGVGSEVFSISLIGKNLFDVNGTSNAFRANKTISGQTITSTATATGTGYVAIVIPNSDNLLGKECSISFSAQASIGDARFRIAAGSSSNPSSVGSVIKTIVGNGSKAETVTFPTSYGTNKDCFVVLLYPHTDDSTWNVGDYATFTNIQLELGSSTTYVPYYNYELCKIGDYQDYIYKSGDDWYAHKAVGKISSYNGEIITTDYISTTGILANGATVYYCLADATDTQITDATLIGQLNAVHEWLTRYGYNATVNGNLPLIVNRTNL